MADRDIVAEIAAELKLSRRKVLAVLDLWDAKCAEPSPERVAFMREITNDQINKLKTRLFIRY
jgi:hypothetical protein